ncbi:MAG: rhomboid family intramembrane serine protease, partial [Flavobacteriales bacterium]|nr:rhomboid family intramembrane serine protease [Flavobacteriales bacterium]
MHGNFTHLFFNMFALWMFGKILENVWGAKRFLIYYMITALGAAALHLAVSQYQIYELSNEVPNLIELAKKGLYNPSIENSLRLTQLVTTPTVGASGAVFGILLAFGMLFPNTLLYIYFAIPIKAKYFVMIYGALELYSGLSNNPADNVAHFAHLGGMLFGYILLKYWQKNHTQFY